VAGAAAVLLILQTVVSPAIRRPMWTVFRNPRALPRLSIQTGEGSSPSSPAALDGHMSKRAVRPAKSAHAALRGGESEGSSPGNGRSAGREGMAGPDTTWDIVAQASDASFPCSDPPPWSAVRVGEGFDRD